MERILVAFNDDRKTKYGWIVGFTGCDAIILRYKGTTFTKENIFQIEKVYSYITEETSFTEDYWRDEIEESIKRYESKDEDDEDEYEEQEEQHHSGLISWPI